MSSILTPPTIRHGMLTLPLRPRNQHCQYSLVARHCSCKAATSIHRLRRFDSDCWLQNLCKQKFCGRSQPVRQMSVEHFLVGSTPTSHLSIRISGAVLLIQRVADDVGSNPASRGEKTDQCFVHCGHNGGGQSRNAREISPSTD